MNPLLLAGLIGGGVYGVSLLAKPYSAGDTCVNGIATDTGLACGSVAGGGLAAGGTSNATSFGTDVAIGAGNAAAWLLGLPGRLLDAILPDWLEVVIVGALGVAAYYVVFHPEVVAKLVALA